ARRLRLRPGDPPQGLRRMVRFCGSLRGLCVLCPLDRQGYRLKSAVAFSIDGNHSQHVSAIKGTSLGRNELLGGNGLLPQGVPSRLSFTTPLDFSLQGFRQIFAGFWKNARRCPSRCLSGKKLELKADHI